MNKLFIGKNNIGGSILPYENALLCYVYGRVTLNTNWFLFLLPSIFFLFHQATEVSIKTLLKLKEIKYPTKGQAGHKTFDLLKLAANSNSFSKNINDLLGNDKLTELLKVMDDSYLNNKYKYPGYNLQGTSLRDLIDEIILIIFEEVNSILKLKVPKHALATFNVPESVEKMFLYKLKRLPIYTVLEFDRR